MKRCRAGSVLVMVIASSAQAYAQTPAPAAEPLPQEAPPPAPAAPAPPPAYAEPAPAPAPAPAPVAVAPDPAPIDPAPAPPGPPPSVGGRPAPAEALKLETATSNIKIGFLLQPQYEALGHPVLDNVSHSLFIRRTRVLIGGAVFKNFEFFFDTDYPDLFRAAQDTGVKNSPGLNIQDAFATVKAWDDMLKVDVGYMLPPLSHNAVQGATSLYGWDYFANTFRHTNAFGATPERPPVGRDAGLQLRGLVLDGHLEYRLGIFDGLRNAATMTDVGARNFFRIAGRVQINLLDPETAFFYGGTYLGAKRIFSVGASYDFQDSYKHSSFDAILDLPLGPGVLTAQVNVGHWNGDDFIAALPSQTALSGEAGYLFNAISLSPIFRAERRWVTNETGVVPDETRLGLGVAFWPYGHNVNLKAFFMRIDPEPAEHAYNQFNLQGQLFVF